MKASATPLNPQQRQAVENTEGPTLIIAGPGSGKTRVITERIAHLINDLDVPPDNILAVTFTNKAAGEMQRRVAASTRNHVNNANIGTFHRIAGQILRASGAAIGIRPDFSVHDSEDQLINIKRAFELTKTDPAQYQPQSVRTCISLAKSHLLTPEQYAQDENSARHPSHQTASIIYPVYQELLQSQKALDFDDMLMRAVQLLEQHRRIRNLYQRRYRYILVDEFQDTNRVQYQFTKLIVNPQHNNICAVGDPDQGIYGWRAADIANIMDFERDFPNTVRIYLSHNYRSTSTILHHAQTLIRNNKRRIDNPMTSESGSGPEIYLYEATDPNEEAQTLIAALVQNQAQSQKPWDQYAVLYRTNRQSRAVEEACIQIGIPYRIYGGTAFYQRREVKDVLAYLIILANPDDDVSLQRIINTPTRGIGAATIRQLTEYATQNHITMLQALNAISQADSKAISQESRPIPNLSRRAVNAINQFLQMLRNLKQNLSDCTLTEIFDQVIAETGLEKHIRADENGEERWENVIELRNLTEDYPGIAQENGALSQFVQNIATVSSPNEEQPENGSVILSTLHSAKGLEFHWVAISGLCNSVIPLPRSDNIEEERRLLYVGITRAKAEVHLSWTMRYSGQQCDASQFIDEMTDLDFDHISIPPVQLPQSEAP